MLSRRGFIRSAAGLLVAAGAGELLLPERRVWALDQTMLGRDWSWYTLEDYKHDAALYLEYVSEHYDGKMEPFVRMNGAVGRWWTMITEVTDAEP